MRKFEENNATVWKFRVLENLPGIYHYTLGKVDDQSGDQRAKSLGRAESFAKTQHFFLPNQTHSARVVVVDKSTQVADLKSTDALITADRDVTIGVITADCVPIYLVDPVKKVIATVHAGWKGTSGAITKETVLTMSREFGSDPKDLIAAIGPCICQENYEVGSEVVDAISITNVDPRLVALEKSNGKYLLDLRRTNQIQLNDAGVLLSNITIAEQCTFDLVSDFYSARREPSNTGRLVHMLGFC